MGNKHPSHLWQPGESGNPNGRPPKGTSLTELMKEHLSKEDGSVNKENKQIFIEKVYEMAMKGDMAAIKLIFNYHEGLPKQSIQIGNLPDDNSVLNALKDITPPKNEE